MRLLAAPTTLLGATLMGMLALLAAEAASAVELLDAELVAAGSPVLEKGTGTVRLEQGRLDAVGRRVFVVVPEPGMLWQFASGIGLLVLLARRRSRHAEKENAVTKKRFRLRAPWFAILLMCVAVPALAQVPQDMTYTGRLLNERGKPLSGPVNLELRIFDAETYGNQLYSEEHLGVPLDETGGFSVQLGLGTSPSGPFDADLFTDVNRWLEVVVDGEVLIPRQIIGSVPWALIAERVAVSDTQVLHVFDVNGRDLGLLASTDTILNPGARELSVFIPGIGEVRTDRMTGDVAQTVVNFDSPDCTQGYLGSDLAGVVVRSSEGVRYFLGDIGEPTHIVDPYYRLSSTLQCEWMGPGSIEVIPVTEITAVDLGLPWPPPLYVGLAPEAGP